MMSDGWVFVVSDMPMPGVSQGWQRRHSALVT